MREVNDKIMMRNTLIEVGGTIDDFLADICEVVDRSQNPNGRDGSINASEWLALKEAMQALQKADYHVQRFLALTEE